MPEQAGRFIRKLYFGISNIATFKQKALTTVSLPNNGCSIIFHCVINELCELSCYISRQLTVTDFRKFNKIIATRSVSSDYGKTND